MVTPNSPLEMLPQMRRLVGLVVLIAALSAPTLAEAARRSKARSPSQGSSFVEIDRVTRASELGRLTVDSAGDIVDPDCRLMADEIAQRIAQKRVSAPVAKNAIAHHINACNTLRETQYKEMEENQRRISADRAREDEEKAKDRETKRSACVETCRTACAANCPPAIITGGTAASGLITSDGACPVTCPPPDVCEKRCAR
jgi:hypothetical protein